RFSEHHDAIADADRLFQLVCNEDCGRAALPRQLEKSVAQFRSRHFVEMPESFIRKKNVGLHCKGARDRNALPHAAGQFMWVGIGEIAEAKPFEPGEGTLALFRLRQADKFERKPRIVERRTPRQEPVLLKDGRNLPTEIIEVGMRAFVSDMD